MLAGIDEWDRAPHATAWLLQHPPRTTESAAAEKVAVTEHRELMLTVMLQQLRRCVRALAKSDRHALGTPSGAVAAHGVRVPHLATDVTHAVAAAARAALLDPMLFPPRAAERVGSD